MARIFKIEKVLFKIKIDLQIMKEELLAETLIPKMSIQVMPLL